MWRPYTCLAESACVTEGDLPIAESLWDRLQPVRGTVYTQDKRMGIACRTIRSPTNCLGCRTS
ncbi:hypothetical protein MPLB_1540061 [Mesorhizobium sp. ORS 3324]|nr:hypothetical protein MPLB_1540061 [Mesorhizobium sp. ORS 3324]